MCEMLKRDKKNVFQQKKIITVKLKYCQGKQNKTDEEYKENSFSFFP